MLSTADPQILSWIAGSVAVANAVNPNGIKALLANGISTYLRQSCF